jgi:hypothetical protein
MLLIASRYDPLTSWVTEQVINWIGDWNGGGGGSHLSIMTENKTPTSNKKRTETVKFIGECVSDYSYINAASKASLYKSKDKRI